MMRDFTVTFCNSQDHERVIGTFQSASDNEYYVGSQSIIASFLEEHHFVSHYQRSTKVQRRGINDVEWIDVGSWSEFFYIYPVCLDLLNLEDAFDG